MLDVRLLINLLPKNANLVKMAKLSQKPNKKIAFKTITILVFAIYNIQNSHCTQYNHQHQTKIPYHHQSIDMNKDLVKNYLPKIHTELDSNKKKILKEIRIFGEEISKEMKKQLEEKIENAHDNYKSTYQIYMQVCLKRFDEIFTPILNAYDNKINSHKKTRNSQHNTGSFHIDNPSFHTEKNLSFSNHLQFNITPTNQFNTTPNPLQLNTTQSALQFNITPLSPNTSPHIENRIINTSPQAQVSTFSPTVSQKTKTTNIEKELSNDFYDASQEVSPKSFQQRKKEDKRQEKESNNRYTQAMFSCIQQFFPDTYALILQKYDAEEIQPLLNEKLLYFITQNFQINKQAYIKKMKQIEQENIRQLFKKSQSESMQESQLTISEQQLIHLFPSQSESTQQFIQIQIDNIEMQEWIV